jgi:hypothetical protein
MAIHGFFGSLGSGKDITCQHILQSKLKRKQLVTHCKVSYPHILMTLEQIFDKAISDTNFFQNKMLYLSEFHLIVESRRSTAGVNVDFSQTILIQLSKLDCDLFFTSQLLSQIDLRIKEMQKYFYFCRKVIRPTMARFDPDARILMDLDTGELIKFDIEVDYLVRDGEHIDFTSFILPWNVLKTYFKIYDTREIVKFNRNKYLRR